MKKIITTLALCCMFFINATAATSIMGTQIATADRMYEFVKAQNSSFDREIAEQFLAVGKVYGIRGDIAFCQSIIETGWFKFADGTAVTPDQHNYCGLGVTSLGVKGESFATIKDGVTAQIQHLYAYACTKSIPAGETLIDNRFKYVDRGCAPNWEDLSGKWSTQQDYGEKIVEKYKEMMAFTMPGGTTPTPNPSASITASQMNVSLSGVQGATPPSTTITITGSNLSSAIAYNSSSSAFSVATSNWNDYTGGSLTITLDTSKAIGSYSGYIAVQSGSTRIEIQCTGTITENTTKPTLIASQTNISLTGVQGETAPSTSIVITGSNLTGPISYNPSTSAVKVTTSNWNDYTGGTLNVTLDTSKDAGTYSGYIAVQSGSGDNKVRIEIQCTATIKESETIPQLSFVEGWNWSETKGMNNDNQWALSVRNMDFADGKLYCVYNNNSIKIVDARSGIAYGTLKTPSTIVIGSSYQLCDVKCIDNCIIACNLVASANGGELRFYQWANDNAEPTLLHSVQVSERTGDCFGVAGSVNGTLRLVTGNSAGVITEYTRTNNKWSSKKIETGINTGTATRVIPVDGGYHIDGSSILPTMVNNSGTVLYSLTTAETNKSGNSFDTFSYDSKNYLMTATYLDKTATTLDEGAMRLYDITNGWGNGSVIGTYPANGLGSERNTNFAGSVITNADKNYAEAWVLVQGQGIAYYKSGNAPAPNVSTGINNTLSENTAKIITDGNVVTVLGCEASTISLVSLTGTIVATSNDNNLEINDINSGIYITIATLQDSTRLSTKIVVK